jgi:hypothetical protein
MGRTGSKTGAGTRKARNIERDARCSIAVSIRDADVFEGDAAWVADSGRVARLARAWGDNGRSALPDGPGSGITAPFNVPAQGPPPWSVLNVYRVAPRSALVTLGGTGRLELRDHRLDRRPDLCDRSQRMERG